MKQFTATILPMVLLGLATNCDPGGGGDGATGGAADAGEGSHDAGAGGSAAGESGSNGENGAGESAGDGAGGEADDGGGTDEGGEGGVAAGATGSGGLAGGGAGTGAGGAGGTDESPAGAAGVPDDAAGGTGATNAGGSGGVAAGTTGGASAAGGSGAATTAGSGGDGTPAINAVAWLKADSCERPVPFEVRDVRYADGTPVTDYTCVWRFSEGGTPHETCAGTVVQGWGDTMQGTVVVRDSATGATTTATTDTILQIEPQALEVWAFADNCMEFSYEVDRQYGCGGAHTIDIQPAENILTPGPWSIHSGILQVSKPGVYTVTYEVAGCAPQFSRTCVTTDVARIAVEECPYP